MSRGEWRAAKRPLDERANVLRTRLLGGRRRVLLGGVDLSGDLRAAWDRMTTAQRRELISTVVERVDVKPADPHRRWDPERFAITWRS